MLEILKTAEHETKDHPERPIVIAYYTVDTPYEAEAEVLKLSLESVGYSYFVCGVRNLGNWQKNTQYKAIFIQHMLEKYIDRTVLYLDVDAIMVQHAILLDNLEADIAAVHFAGCNLLSGTLYFGNTVQSRRVVQKWINMNERYPETLPNGLEAWDQRTLEMVIKKIEKLHYVELPQEYTFIVELTQRRCPDIKNPVIMHTRGAKRFKNAINKISGFAR
jgi:lipopolysaccharide biosynthesis glycosyltransferase